MREILREKIFRINNYKDFNNTAIDVFNHQYRSNEVYRSFTDHLNRKPEVVKDIHDIPFLPIEFFKSQRILSAGFPVDVIFESSGTTGTVTSRHFVKDLSLYEESFLRGFRMFYGDPEQYIIAALLPSYTERRGSSLVYMVDKLIRLSKHELSGFYRDDIQSFIKAIQNPEIKKQKTLLIGVSFALIDLAEQYAPDLSGVIIMETGGMKGRRKELTRQELHSVLAEKLNVPSIHSEYGMTELLSQAYSKGEGLFYCPPWMKILIRDPQDPLTIYSEPGRAGGINIIDLANLNSLSFIATSDLGRLHEDGGFEVIGRFDNSDIRGCNLMAE
jgi:phenylacetate-coenzyme A ligase PaaK-like adenylate-forming protein